MDQPEAPQPEVAPKPEVEPRPEVASKPEAAATPAAPARWWLRSAVAIYILGFVLDTLWHIETYMTTGDRRIELFELVTGIQASLFWPVHILFQVVLALT